MVCVLVCVRDTEGQRRGRTEGWWDREVEDRQRGRDAADNRAETDNRGEEVS